MRLDRCHFGEGVGTKCNLFDPFVYLSGFRLPPRSVPGGPVPPPPRALSPFPLPLVVLREPKQRRSVRGSPRLGDENCIRSGDCKVGGIGIATKGLDL